MTNKNTVTNKQASSEKNDAPVLKRFMFQDTSGYLFSVEAHDYYEACHLAREMVYGC